MKNHRPAVCVLSQATIIRTKSVLRYLSEVELNKIFAKRKPLLTKFQKQRRLQSARGMILRFDCFW